MCRHPRGASSRVTARRSRPCRPPARRQSDVDAFGRSERLRAVARQVFDPGLPLVVPRRVGGPGARARHRWRAARRQPRRRPARPTRRSSSTASRGARPAGLRPGRPPLPGPARGRHAVVAPRRRGRPIRTTPNGCSATTAHWCWSSPRAPRARPRPTATATSCAASGGAASSRSPCGPACPIIPIAVVGAEEAMPSVASFPDGARQLGLPYLPLTANMLALRPARRRDVVPRQAPAARSCRRSPSTCRPARPATPAAG